MCFKTWILNFENEDTARGDLAYDIMRDEEFPMTNDYDEICEHLFFRDAEQIVLDVFDDVWNQYSKDENIKGDVK